VPNEHPAKTLGERFFVPLARTAASLPRIRGKTRALLAIYRLLHLDRRHVYVRTRLRDPLEFQAELDLHSWLQRLAFLTGEYEADTVRFLLDLRRRYGRDDYLLDIGANIGLLAIPFAMATPRKWLSVIAIEAAPDNIIVLRRNVALNGLQNAIKIIPLGVGAFPGEFEIQVEGDLRCGEGTGTANILPRDSTYQCVTQTISVTTIDELARAGDVPTGCSVVKIDTDGYDLNVLRGASAFLMRDRPVIFGEFSRDCLRWHGQSVIDVAAFAEAHGYQSWRRIDRTWRFRRFGSADESDFAQDLLLVPSEAEERFGALLDQESR
jgi:FkbM family methyltransferase